jgi:nickel/cobalt transporter (NicO) family protein
LPLDRIKSNPKHIAFRILFMKMRPVLWLAAAAALMGHPLGNFSVNHYARFEPSAGGIELQYVIDLAEIPTFELLREWNLDRNSPHDQLEARALEQSGVWASGLSITVSGTPVIPIVRGVSLTLADGAGNLPIVRITAKMHISATAGTVEYEDRNFDGRAGWKEIVIAAGPGAHIQDASQGDQDLSHALSQYPPNPTIAPPQDLKARFVWTASVVSTSRTIIKPVAQPASPPAPPSPAVSAKNPPAGTVVKNDYLSRLLRRDNLPLSAIAIGLAIAFVLGAAHALTPGHGKTVVAAYLVGSRGTMKHAAFLGGVVTLTHTISVFGLGLATLFLFKFVVPEKITEILGVISGLSIVVIGGWMLYRGIRRKQHQHHHHHSHDHHHAHDHDHHHHDHDHTHDHGHSHVPEGDISWGTLMTLAVGGGLAPCESALILLLGAIALGRVGLGLVLVLAFSIGLATVLVAIGMMVLYFKRLLPATARHSHGAFARWIPVGSAAIVITVGLLMTAVSAGIVPVAWLV